MLLLAILHVQGSPLPLLTGWHRPRRVHNAIAGIYTLQRQEGIEGWCDLQAKKRKSGAGSGEAAGAEAGSREEESEEEGLEQPGLD